LAFVVYPHPVLALKAESRAVDDDLRAVGERLLAAQRESRAQGLAAAHIGEAAPVVAIRLPGSADGAATLFYNPVVGAVADETASGPEGSVSLPGIEIDVIRPVWADIGWQDGTGAAQSERFTGLAARIALHEIDQMNGVFFLSRVSRLKREMALKKWKKLADRA